MALNWIEDLLKTVLLADGVVQPSKQRWNFKGVTVVKNITEDRLDITFPGGDGAALAGAGLEDDGGGKLRVKTVDGDTSIVRSAAGTKVGEISDAQHGERGGGALHDDATTGASGFMSAADKTQLDENTADLDAAGDADANTLARRDETGAIAQRNDAVSTAVVVGARLVNTTAATLAAAQYSPAITLESQSAPEVGASLAVQWAVQGRPRNDGAHKSDLWIGYDINGGGFGEVVSIGSDGVITCGGVTTTGDVSCDGATAASLTATDHLELGAAPRATVGTVRTPSSFALVARDDGDSADVPVITWGYEGTDVAGIGDDTATAGVVVQTGTGDVAIKVGGTERLRVDSTGVSCTGAVACDSLAATNAVTCGSATVTASALGSTPTAAHTLQNTTAAANGAQQFSPAHVLKGNGWGTTAGTSQPVEWWTYCQPVQGTTPTGAWRLALKVNGGSLSTMLSIDSGSGGVMTFAGSLFSMSGSANPSCLVQNTDGTIGKIQAVAGGPVYMGSQSNHDAAFASNNAVRILLDKAGLQAKVTTQIATPFNAATDAATVTFDCSKSNVHKVTLAGNRTIAFSNLADGSVVELHLIQDATAGRAVTWPSNAKFGSAGAPSLSTLANARDIIIGRSDGTNVYFHTVAKGF